MGWWITTMIVLTLGCLAMGDPNFIPAPLKEKKQEKQIRQEQEQKPKEKKQIKKAGDHFYERNNSKQAT